MRKNMEMGGGKYYSSERNIQIVISLLKQNGIRKVVTSPGATNVTFVGSLQNDSFFELYSCVDERSAAYMACGLSAESGEPVVLSCTGATSSRNYLPALTDAFYRKLPILAITSSQFSSRIGQMVAQVTDRTAPPRDSVIRSFNLETTKDTDDEWSCTIKVNEAISCLSKNGGGPVHINLVTSYSRNFSTKQLPVAKKIERVDFNSPFPKLPEGKIGIFIGSHRKFTEELTNAIDSFCAEYDGVVFCDSSSNYFGRYRVEMPLVFLQKYYYPSFLNLSLLVHIGEITGDYTIGQIKCNDVWRVSEDSEIRDLFHKLSHLFNMQEEYFFKHYTSSSVNKKTSLLEACKQEVRKIEKAVPELPFSNLWIAQQTAPLIPTGAQVHLGILNSLRSWNLFLRGTEAQCNVGGFGIDGCLSSLIGSYLAHPEKTYFGIIGDLSFFYDVNSIFTKGIKGNLRIMVVNNGRGTEFRTLGHIAAEFGEQADPYMAAAGHFGNKSTSLLKDLAADAGFHYLSASNKKEYLAYLPNFLNTGVDQAPVIFEVFTDSKDETKALATIELAYSDKRTIAELAAKGFLKKVLGKRGIVFIKSILHK